MWPDATTPNGCRPIFVIGLAVSEVHLNIRDWATTKHNSSLIQRYPFECLNNEISLIAKINCVLSPKWSSNIQTFQRHSSDEGSARHSKSIL